jgi:hypothetical protein
VSIHDMLRLQLDQVRTDTEPVAGDDLADDGFDPSQHTVDAVLAYVKENPDQAAAIVAAERDGKHRSTILDALD